MDKEPIIVKKKFDRDYTFGWEFFKSLYKLLPYFYPSLEWTFVFTVVVVGFRGLSEFLTNHIGHIPGDMYADLINKDKQKFWHTFVNGVLMYIAKCGTLALINLSAWFLYIAYRKNLVKLLQKRYFRNNVYYKLNCLNSEGIDNPDQRLTQDIEKICNLLATKIVPVTFAAPFVIAYYTWKTWKTAQFLGVAIIYGYFLVGSIINRFLIIPLTKWSARVEKSEGDFRYKHVTIRDNAESSILYNAENFENDECNRIFNILLKKQFQNIVWRLPADFWQQFFDYFGGILSYVIQYLPIIILGTYDSESPAELSKTISNNAFVYIYLVNSFTVVTDMAINVGQMAGIFQRVADFVRYTEEVEAVHSGGISNESFDDTNHPEPKPPLVVERQPGALAADVLFELKNVSYSLPTNKHYILMHNLNLRLLRGQNLLISGPSGSGKSSLLRVLMRIWNINSGTITFGVTEKHILHVPQKPYFPTGHLSLHQQIAFPVRLPNTEQTYRDVGIIEDALVKLKISHLIERCGGLDTPVDFEWHEVLSPGELQRLSFVRLLYHRPILAILDESTNAVSLDAERTMYQILIDSGISFITAGHRSSLENYHSYELKLDGKTGYQLTSLHPIDSSGNDVTEL